MEKKYSRAKKQAVMYDWRNNGTRPFTLAKKHGVSEFTVKKWIYDDKAYKQQMECRFQTHWLSIPLMPDVKQI